MGANFVLLIIRLLFSALDRIAFWLVKLVYDLLYAISSTTIAEDVVDSLGNNIYSILGVIMLFKLAFSIITYIINPDKFTDKDAGFTSIIKNVFIVIVLILAVPIIFRQSMNLQRIILKEDIIGRVVTGVSKTESREDDDAGQVIAFNLLSGFIRPNDSVYPNCKDVISSDSQGFTECINSLPSEVSSKYKAALESKEIKDLVDYDIISKTTKDGNNKKVYIFDYTFLVSTGVGVFTAYIFLIFCIDIAVRTIKLIFLRLISPIPIASYIDPKGQKGPFNKWVNNCVKTYLDLFLRLAAIYFAIFMIQNVILNLDRLYIEGTNERPGFFVIIFLILGSLMFAKQLPNLIQDLTGIKLDGKFTLNPIKKIENEALFGKQVAGGVAFAGRTGKNLALGTGAAVGAVANLARDKVGTAFANTPLGQNLRDIHMGVSNTVRSGLTTAGSYAAGLGHMIGNSGVGQAVGDAVGASSAGRYFGKIGADAGGMLGTFTQKADDRKLAAYKNVTDAVSNQENRAGEKIKNNEAGELSKEYNRRAAEIQMLKNQQLKGQAHYDTASNRYITADEDLKQKQAAHAKAIADAQYEFDDWFNNTAKFEYINLNGQDTARAREIFGVQKDQDGNIIGTKSDATLTGFVEDYNQGISAAGFENKTTAEERHKQLGEFKGATNDIKRKRMAQQEAKNGK